MKKTAALILLLSITFCATAQTREQKKNILKLNITSLFLRNISVQYERSLNRKLSVAGLVRVMPKGAVPLKSSFDNYVDDPDTEKQIDNTSIGNVAFIPELRYYFSKKGEMRGFYVALYSTIASYNASLPYQYNDLGQNKTIPMSGHVTTFTGGILLGSQFRITDNIKLDLWILGPNYGTSNGSISGQQSLSPSEQSSLKRELADLDIPFTKTTYDVNSNGAMLFVKGPWAGIRSGICVGFNF